jgi:hypothetical protein
LNNLYRVVYYTMWRCVKLCFVRCRMWLRALWLGREGFARDPLVGSLSVLGPLVGVDVVARGVAHRILCVIDTRTHETRLSVQDGMAMGVKDNEVIEIEGMQQCVRVSDEACSAIGTSFLRQANATVRMHYRLKRVIVEFDEV